MPKILSDNAQKSIFTPERWRDVKICPRIERVKGENIEGSFYEPELQKSSQEVFRIEKVIKQDPKKKLALVKWKGYDDRFNSWVKLSELKNIK